MELVKKNEGMSIVGNIEKILNTGTLLVGALRGEKRKNIFMSYVKNYRYQPLKRGVFNPNIQYALKINFTPGSNDPFVRNEAFINLVDINSGEEISIKSLASYSKEDLLILYKEVDTFKTTVTRKVASLIRNKELA